jgi:hypothetical protein
VEGHPLVWWYFQFFIFIFLFKMFAKIIF